ncbi:ankyrin repeat-containing domain protein [Obelidium mucronatum]|nr:ankyrin repeat-containing domain protein [Obelidium mucronatum]
MVKKVLALQFLPLDVLEAILSQLPIKADLIAVAAASKYVLAPLILNSPGFARHHFRYQYQSSALGFWEFLDDTGIRDKVWLSLPNQYNLAIYREILSTPDWNLVETIPRGPDQSRNLMWSLRWNMPPARAFTIITTLLEIPAWDPSQNDNRPIRWACRNGHVDVVKLLIGHPCVNPSSSQNTCTSYSSHFGHADIVKLLLSDPRVDPTDREDTSFRLACQCNHVEVVRLLLEDGRANPAAKDNTPIIIASVRGHVGVVKLLLADSRVDARAQQGASLYWAKKNGHCEIVELLKHHLDIQ